MKYVKLIDDSNWLSRMVSGDQKQKSIENKLKKDHLTPATQEMSLVLTSGQAVKN